MAGKAKGCVFGVVLGSALRALIFIFNALIKFIANALVLTGLWVPLFYAVFGVILYFTKKFNPFDYGLYGWLYFIGFGLSVVAALLILFRKLVAAPAKSVKEGYKNPIWKRREEDEDERKKVAEADEEKEKKPFLWGINKRGGRGKNRSAPSFGEYLPPEEKPDIYFSAVESDTLIHEYSDRFEVFRLENGKLRKEKVEYKKSE